jgi:5'-nucleotidase
MVVAVVSGHTHRAYNCLLPRSDGAMIPVTQALNNGLLVTTLDVTASLATGVQSVVAHNHIVSHDVDPDPGVAATVASYNAIIAPVANRVVGASTDFMARPVNHALSWTSLGSMIADAQLESTATRAGAQMAFINAGGVRAPLNAGEITYGEAFGVQPFSNQLVTMTLTGQQILTALEQQMASPTDPHCLQPSAGFTFTFSASSTPHTSNVLFNGEALDPAASYRVTVNNFIAGGGDNFGILRQGTNITVGKIDLDALLDYLAAHNPVSAPAPRVTFVP